MWTAWLSLKRLKAKYPNLSPFQSRTSCSAALLMESVVQSLMISIVSGESMSNYSPAVGPFFALLKEVLNFDKKNNLNKIKNILIFKINWSDNYNMSLLFICVLQLLDLLK